MYFFYFDESGNAKMNLRSLTVYPWFTLGAIGFHDSQWKRLDQSITALKAQTFPGVNPEDVEIKSTYIRSWGTTKEKWPWTEEMVTRQRLMQFVDGFYALYEAFDMTLFFAVVDKVAHSKRYRSPRHPYEYAFTVILERLDYFLDEREDIGLCFLDEFKDMERKVISRYIWYRKGGTWVKGSIDNIVEPPTFLNSRSSQMISLADVVAYNTYRRFRENDPTYSFFVRTRDRIYSRPNSNQIWGAGLKVLP